MLVISGTNDRITAHADARALAEATGGTLQSIEGADHVPEGRHPVEVNHAIRGGASTHPFGAIPPSTARTAGGGRCTSPRRSASATRSVTWPSPASCARSHPDLEIDWLAQDPVTRVLEAEGERIHPASAHLANESRHLESESGEHDLHCFQAFRTMDEILAANFMVFDDVVRADRYDLWIGDEAWELDYHLHKNPSLQERPLSRGSPTSSAGCRCPTAVSARRF